MGWRNIKVKIAGDEVTASVKFVQGRPLIAEFRNPVSPGLAIEIDGDPFRLKQVEDVGGRSEIFSAQLRTGRTPAPRRTTRRASPARAQTQPAQKEETNDDDQRDETTDEGEQSEG